MIANNLLVALLLTQHPCLPNISDSSLIKTALPLTLLKNIFIARTSYDKGVRWWVADTVKGRCLGRIEREGAIPSGSVWAAFISDSSFTVFQRWQFGVVGSLPKPVGTVPEALQAILSVTSRYP